MIPFPDDLPTIKTPLEQRVVFEGQERAKFMAQYERMRKELGSVIDFPSFNWSGKVTNIHHIKPKEWGGDNDFWNLVPLDVSVLSPI